jgi:hypothetical protein
MGLRDANQRHRLDLDHGLSRERRGRWQCWCVGPRFGRISPSEIYVDKLLRPASGQPAAASDNAGFGSAGGATGNVAAVGARAEVLRLWTADFRSGADLSSTDRAYVAQVVAARTGLSQADAEKRVDAVVAEAKLAADTMRRNAAHLSFWQPCCSVHLPQALRQLKEEHCATARGMAAFSLPGRFRSIKWALVEAFSCGCSVCRYQSLSC